MKSAESKLYIVGYLPTSAIRTLQRCNGVVNPAFSRHQDSCQTTAARDGVRRDRQTDKSIKLCSNSWQRSLFNVAQAQRAFPPGDTVLMRRVRRISQMSGLLGLLGL